MGAPGYFILCENGHVIGVIEDDMYWECECDEDGYQVACLDKGLWKELKDLENKTCEICKTPAKYKFCHYGNINDCLSTFKLDYNVVERRYIIPSKMTDKQRGELEVCTIKHPIKTSD